MKEKHFYHLNVLNNKGKVLVLTICVTRQYYFEKKSEEIASFSVSYDLEIDGKAKL